MRLDTNKSNAGVTPAEGEVATLLASYWGKAAPESATEVHSHHTVLGHSLDVAACAYTLITQHSTLAVQFDLTLEHEHVGITVAAWCALHDVGKLDTRFQRKAETIADVLRPASSNVPKGRYDHGAEGFRQTEDDDAASAQLHELLGDAALPLLRAVCGHHGSLPSRDEPDPSRALLPTKLRAEDRRARSVFVASVAKFFRERGAVLPWSGSADGALVQRLGGLCAIADWIGSNTEYFPYASGPVVNLSDYFALACERAQRACKGAGLFRVQPANLAFSELFPGYQPRDVQALTEQLDLAEPALVIVEAEMGKGKTEAALALAARFLRSGVSDGLTIGLPTMATSNAMFARVESVVERLFPTGEVQLALAHGRASRQPRFRTLIERGLHARDADNPEASVACARWLLNKKRILLAQVGVGTVDQALQAALVVRHQFVRMFGLSRNVVIIDEVHAYDAYMEVLLDHLIGWLGALGVPTVLLSATLPSERRAALSDAWRGGVSSERPTLMDATTAPYPLVTVTTRTQSSPRVLSSAEPHPSTKTLLLTHERREDDETTYVRRVAERLVNAARAGARVVWIRNTVGEAQRAFDAVVANATDVEHMLFHARFRGIDRASIEMAVLDRFGKAAPAGGRVLVATQVVEQSLDLDFDEMHSDLAPIDLLLQRTGRLHRHVRARPEGFEAPRFIVHAPSDADASSAKFGASVYVYDAGTLWITNTLLRDRAHLELPVDIRPMVEAVYHPMARAARLNEGGKLLLHAEQVLSAQLEARRTKAHQCCIPPTSADPDGVDTLPDDDDAIQAFTRDGSSVTLLPFAWTEGQGRTLFSPNSTAWHLDAERSDAWKLSSELIDQTLSLPARSEVDARPQHSRAEWQGWLARFTRFAEEGGVGRRVVPLPLARVGDEYEGSLRMYGKERRVTYSRRLGLRMPSEKDEREAR